MKAFLASLVVMAVISVAADLVLNRAGLFSSAQWTAADSVRLGD